MAGTGSAVPDRVLTNADLEKMVDTSDEWITTRTGIKERRIADPETASSDLAALAAGRALAASGTDPASVDLIIVATVTPDMLFPATACIVQHRLGAHRAAAFDLSAGCSGFVYALGMGAQAIASGLYETVLVAGVDCLSKITDFQDRSTCVLFGDAAGAAVLKPAAPGYGLLAIQLGADGSGADKLSLPAGGSRIPVSKDAIDSRLNFIHMAGNEVFKFAVRIMEEASHVVLSQSGLDASDIDLFVPHQANIRIIEAAAKRLGVPSEKVFVNVQKYGNTSAASIAVALDEANAEGRLRPGDKVLLVGFGAGLTWASAVLCWGMGGSS